MDTVTELASFSGMKKSYADSDKKDMEEKAAASGEAKPEKIIPTDRYLRKGEILHLYCNSMWLSLFWFIYLLIKISRPFKCEHGAA